MGFAGGSTRVLWVEKAPLQLQILWLSYHRLWFGFFPKAESNFLLGSSVSPPVSPRNAVLCYFPRYNANAVPRLPLLTLPPLSLLFGVQIHCLPHWEWPSHLVNRWLRHVLEPTACHVADGHHPGISPQKKDPGAGAWSCVRAGPEEGELQPPGGLSVDGGKWSLGVCCLKGKGIPKITGTTAAGMLHHGCGAEGRL